MTKSLIFALAATALLTGCAPTYQPPPGTSEQQAMRDNFECSRDALTASSGVDGLAGAAIGMRLKQMCMAGRGYAEVRR